MKKYALFNFFILAENISQTEVVTSLGIEENINESL